MSSRPELKLAWCSYNAAKYAVEHWHYSRCMPVGKLILVGVWERELFIGAIMYGRGATPNLGKPYGLKQTECVELVRIALKSHHNPVSRMLAFAGKMVANHNPGLRLVVSFADASQGHHGGIYQAANWVYCGSTSKSKEYWHKGRRLHSRQVSEKGWNIQQGQQRKTLRPSECKIIHTPGKYRYLLPLDPEMRKQIAPLSKPYPKRDKQAMSATSATAAV